MSFNDTLIHENSYYRVVERKKTNNEYVELEAGEYIGVQFDGGVYDRFMIDSVASQAIRQGRCPVRSITTHGIYNQNLWFLSKYQRCEDGVDYFHNVINMEIGDKIKFEGRLFELVKNDSYDVKLKLID